MTLKVPVGHSKAFFIVKVKVCALTCACCVLL